MIISELFNVRDISKNFEVAVITVNKRVLIDKLIN